MGPWDARKAHEFVARRMLQETAEERLRSLLRCCCPVLCVGIPVYLYYIVLQRLSFGLHGQVEFANVLLKLLGSKEHAEKEPQHRR